MKLTQRAKIVAGIATALYVGLPFIFAGVVMLMAMAVPFGEFHEGHAVERVGGPARPDLAARSNATYRVIGSDYFRALNLPMVRGREFSSAEETSATSNARRRTTRKSSPTAPATTPFRSRTSRATWSCSGSALTRFRMTDRSTGCSRRRGGCSSRAAGC